MTTESYYQERRKMQLQAIEQKRQKMLSEDYTDHLCYSCENCDLKDICQFQYQESLDGKSVGCEFRHQRFLEKFSQMSQTGDDNIDRAIKLLARMEVEMDIHLIKLGGKSSKNSIALARTLIHGWLRVQEAQKGRIVNINKTDILSINTPELEQLEKKLEKLKQWEAQQEATQS